MSGVVQKQSRKATVARTKLLLDDKEALRQTLKKHGLSPRRFLDDDDVARILAEMEAALRGRRTSRQGRHLPPHRARQRFQSPDLDAIEAKMDTMLAAVTPGIDARQSPKLRGEWALGEWAERELRSSAEWKALEAEKVRAKERASVRAKDWSSIIASTDTGRLKHDINARISVSNLFLARFVGLPHHKRLKELEKVR